MSVRPGDDFDSAEFSYSCTCDNPAGTYASPKLDNDCARTDSVYAERCIADSLRCAPGAGGNAYDRRLTAADIAELPLSERSGLIEACYYKTGQTCTAEDCCGSNVGAIAGIIIGSIVGLTMLIVNNGFWLEILRQDDPSRHIIGHHHSLTFNTRFLHHSLISSEAQAC